MSDLFANNVSTAKIKATKKRNMQPQKAGTLLKHKNHGVCIVVMYECGQYAVVCLNTGNRLYDGCASGHVVDLSEFEKVLEPGDEVVIKVG